MGANKIEQPNNSHTRCERVAYSFVHPCFFYFGNSEEIERDGITAMRRMDAAGKQAVLELKDPYEDLPRMGVCRLRKSCANESILDRT